MHARQGAALDRTSAEAWSVLAFALHLNGEREHAAAAAWKAVALGTPAPTPIVSEPPAPEPVAPESPDTAQSGPESADPIAPAT